MTESTPSKARGLLAITLVSWGLAGVCFFVSARGGATAAADERSAPSVSAGRPDSLAQKPALLASTGVPVEAVPIATTEFESLSRGDARSGAPVVRRGNANTRMTAPNRATESAALPVAAAIAAAPVAVATPGSPVVSVVAPVASAPKIKVLDDSVRTKVLE
jgi:hypothetical protein